MQNSGAWYDMGSWEADVFADPDEVGGVIHEQHNMVGEEVNNATD